MARSSSDLPAPDGPVTAKHSPSARSNETGPKFPPATSRTVNTPAGSCKIPSLRIAWVSVYTDTAAHGTDDNFRGEKARVWADQLPIYQFSATIARAARSPGGYIAVAGPHKVGALGGIGVGNIRRFGYSLGVAALALAAPLSASAEITNPAGVAVIIGNSAYEGGLPEVTYAGNDATAFRAYLVDVLGFDPANIIDLPNASKAQIEATFGNAQTHQGRLWRLVEPGVSEVVVFYSGHGVPGSDNRAYLLPVDADPDVPEINGYALELLYGNLAKLEALSVAVYIDACFSGQSYGGALSRTSGLGLSPALPAAAGGFGVLTAAAADQVAVWDDDAKHGVFTKHLLDALNGAADGEGFGNGDNTITLTEAKAYLDLNMTRAARRIGRQQDPSMDGNADLVLAAFGADGPPGMNFGPATPGFVAVPTRDVVWEHTYGGAGDDWS